MKRNIFANFLPGLWLGAVALYPAAALAEVADRILLSNHVVTLSSLKPAPARPMAVAIKGDRIAWMGPKEQIAQFTGDDTEVIDLGDQALLPGFVDAHGHLPFAALATTIANVASPPVGPVETIEDLQNTLRAYAAERDIPKGEWIVGMGYDDSLLAEQRHPNRDELDAVSIEHPIMLLHVSGHLTATNSRGLARAGYSSETPDPPGGHIRRRPGSAEPNGVLEETATYPLRGNLNAANKDPIGAVVAALQEYASHGITSTQDGASSAEAIALMRQVAEQGQLIMDVVAYPVGMGGIETVSSQYEWGEYDKGLKVGGVKLMLDGSPQGKTAYLSKPYHVPPHGKDGHYRGYPNIQQPRVDELVASYLDQRIPMLAHANGDAAAQMLIDAVAAADPEHDHRTVMIHAQTLREDQITRMKGLAMVPSYFSAHTFYWGDWHRDSVLGEERGSRISPTASTQQRGMPFTVHNDAPVVPPDMIRLLWATTNRKTRSGKVLGPEQRLSIYDALRAMTIYGAYQNFEENDKGTIETGKRADLVVLSENPLTMDPADLMDLKVVATYARGQQIYPH